MGRDLFPNDSQNHVCDFQMCFKDPQIYARYSDIFQIQKCMCDFHTFHVFFRSTNIMRHIRVDGIHKYMHNVFVYFVSCLAFLNIQFCVWIVGDRPHEFIMKRRWKIFTHRSPIFTCGEAITPPAARRQCCFLHRTGTSHLSFLI